MPALKEKAVCLLGSATVNFATGSGAQTLFTVPVGKVARITHVVVRDTSATLAGSTNVTLGTAFRGNASIHTPLATMSTSGTDYLVLDQDNTKSTELAAGANFQITPTAGATATGTIDVFGYLT